MALLLAKITDLTGIAERCFRIVFQGHYFYPDARLRDYKLGKDVTIHLFSGLRGGDGRSLAPSSSKQQSFKEAAQNKDPGAASLRPKALLGQLIKWSIRRRRLSLSWKTLMSLSVDTTSPE